MWKPQITVDLALLDIHILWPRVWTKWLGMYALAVNSSVYCSAIIAMAYSQDTDKVSE